MPASRASSRAVAMWPQRVLHQEAVHAAAVPVDGVVLERRAERCQVLQPRAAALRVRLLCRRQLVQLRRAHRSLIKAALVARSGPARRPPRRAQLASCIACSGTLRDVSLTSAAQ